MCRLVPGGEIVTISAGPVANGWFGVGKCKYLPGTPEAPENEILRFIMHFVPVNSMLYPIEGDVGCLPYFGQWSTLQLESWQYFAWSPEDIACMFYVFRILSCRIYVNLSKFVFNTFFYSKLSMNIPGHLAKTPSTKLNIPYHLYIYAYLDICDTIYLFEHP